MYVHIKSEPSLWTVGHYDPLGKWHPDSDHDDEDSARQRVAQLNGGGVEAAAEVARLRQLCGDAASRLATMTCPTMYADAVTHDTVVRMLREAAGPGE